MSCPQDPPGIAQVLWVIPAITAFRPPSSPASAWKWLSPFPKKKKPLPHLDLQRIQFKNAEAREKAQGRRVQGKWPFLGLWMSVGIWKCRTANPKLELKRRMVAINCKSWILGKPVTHQGSTWHFVHITCQSDDTPTGRCIFTPFL